MAGNTTANVADADVYIESNVIVAEDWLDNEAAKKQSIVNVAQRIIVGKYADYTIPDNAIYEFCAVLATQFNDTNKLFQQGIAGFSITGVASFTDKQNARKPAEQLIPKAAFDYINDDPANDDLPKLGIRKIGRTVL
jgi:hypothetical protein